MSRLLAVVVVSLVLVGGMVAADVAHEQTDAPAGDEDLQGDLLDTIVHAYEITFILPFVLVIAAIMAALGLFSRL